jgi:translation initiation factor 4A
MKKQTQPMEDTTQYDGGVSFRNHMRKEIEQPSLVVSPDDIYSDTLHDDKKKPMTWDSFSLHHDLLRGIYTYGFDTPSEIQQKAIPAMFTKQDVLVQAQSGMGKTGAFTIGILQQINTTLHFPQAIILVHTHELAKQVTQVCQSLGIHMDGLRIQTLVGGTPIQEDIRLLTQSPPHIIIGCLGRIYDMLQRHMIKTTHINILCVDEADEILLGCKQQLYHLFQYLPTDIQVTLFSATIPDDMHQLTTKFMRTPIMITMKKEELNLECISQYYIVVQNDHEKYQTLQHLFSSISISQCILYCNTVTRVMNLYHQFCQDGFSVGCIHSHMSKGERDVIMKEFRNGSCRYLISSNLTARGIDVQQVSTVINVDVPNCVHTYLHRIGRSGRWGRKGMAINLVTRYDVRKIQEIEKYYHSTISEFTC